MLCRPEQGLMVESDRHRGDLRRPVEDELVVAGDGQKRPVATIEVNQKRLFLGRYVPL